MLYFSATVETAVTVQKSQQEEPVQGVTTGLLGLAHSVRMASPLSENGITALHLSETDIQTMAEILLIVLGDEGIEKTWGLSTTQSNEAANRALSS